MSCSFDQVVTKLVLISCQSLLGIKRLRTPLILNENRWPTFLGHQTLFVRNSLQTSGKLTFFFFFSIAPVRIVPMCKWLLFSYFFIFMLISLTRPIFEYTKSYTQANEAGKAD